MCTPNMHFDSFQTLRGFMQWSLNFQTEFLPNHFSSVYACKQMHITPIIITVKLQSFTFSKSLK